MQRSFREVFCEYSKCDPKDFVLGVFFECLDLRSLGLFYLAAFVEKVNIANSCRLIEEAGDTCDEGSLRQLLKKYSEPGRTIKDGWEVRVSPKRLLRLNAKVRSKMKKSEDSVPDRWQVSKHPINGGFVTTQ